MLQPTTQAISGYFMAVLMSKLKGKEALCLLTSRHTSLSSQNNTVGSSGLKLFSISSQSIPLTKRLLLFSELANAFRLFAIMLLFVNMPPSIGTVLLVLLHVWYTPSMPSNLAIVIPPFFSFHWPLPMFSLVCFFVIIKLYQKSRGISLFYAYFY